MSLYQPLSRAISQRDVSGCLTPQNQPESDTDVKLSSFTSSPASLKRSFTDGPGFNKPTRSSILSPPLSPYQRHPTIDKEHSISLEPSTFSLLEQPTPHHLPQPLPQPEVTKSKNYVASSAPFKIENYKSYELTVNPWNNLSHNYKQRQLNFLEQYSIISSSSPNQPATITRQLDRRGPLKRRYLNSDSDSESSLERVRTRKVVKDKSIHIPTDLELNSSSTRSSSPSPKKPRKAKKETSYASSPLALQQAALIDENIPDYSPDAALTLPQGNNRALKVEWKGQPMDLRNDPNLAKLHPAEVVLASTLRLPCNVYMDSKRRLFFEKVTRSRNGMQFRRTDAQKACRIDVNKASRLFAAFEKVGWLKDEHFDKYL